MHFLKFAREINLAKNQLGGVFAKCEKQVLAGKIPDSLVKIERGLLPEEKVLKWLAARETPLTEIAV